MEVNIKELTGIKIKKRLNEISRDINNMHRQIQIEEKDTRKLERELGNIITPNRKLILNKFEAVNSYIYLNFSPVSDDNSDFAYFMSKGTACDTPTIYSSSDADLGIMILVSATQDEVTYYFSILNMTDMKCRKLVVLMNDYNLKVIIDKNVKTSEISDESSACFNYRRFLNIVQGTPVVI